MVVMGMSLKPAIWGLNFVLMLLASTLLCGLLDFDVNCVKLALCLLMQFLGLLPLKSWQRSG